MFLSINYLLFIIVNETGTDVIKLHYWKKKKKKKLIAYKIFYDIISLFLVLANV